MAADSADAATAPAGGSGWSLLPAGCVSASAPALLVAGADAVGFALLACGLLAALWTDRSARTVGLTRDLIAIAGSLVILNAVDLSADLSDAGMLRFTLTLGGALVWPHLWLRGIWRDDRIRFPWGGWRWSRAQWGYLLVVVVAGYLILPWYFLSSGVYRNWPAIHEPAEIGRLFIGVNAVGIWDELFFISTVFALLRQHYGLAWANVLQAVVFVSFLWELGYQAWGPLLTIPFALVQGAIFQLTKNLTYVIVVHLLFDVVVFLVLVHAHNSAWPHPFVLLG